MRSIFLNFFSSTGGGGSRIFVVIPIDVLRYMHFKTRDFRGIENNLTCICISQVPRTYNIPFRSDSVSIQVLRLKWFPILEKIQVLEDSYVSGRRYCVDPML